MGLLEWIRRGLVEEEVWQMPANKSAQLPRNKIFKNRMDSIEAKLSIDP